MASFSVPVDTEIGTVKDEITRFFALISYALAQKKKLDQATIKRFDRRGYTSQLALENALAAALSQSIHHDEFIKHITEFKTQHKTAEELNHAARQWLRQKTNTWLDWQSIDSDDVLPHWMQQVIEDKPIASPVNYADEDWIWIAGNTKDWMNTIKRYARLHGDKAAKWNGRKLAWHIQFKAWHALLKAHPRAADELYVMS